MGHILRQSRVKLGLSNTLYGAVGFIFQGLRSNFGFLMYPRLFTAEWSFPIRDFYSGYIKISDWIWAFEI